MGGPRNGQEVQITQGEPVRLSTLPSSSSAIQHVIRVQSSCAPAPPVGKVQKTMAQIVCGVLHVQQISIAQIGRQLAVRTGVFAKHAIKRVDRYLSNPRIEPTEAMAKTIRWISLPSKRLVVSIDWVDIRRFHCLMPAGWCKGRAIPLLWQVIRWEDLHRSTNSIEYGMLRLLRTCVPPQVEVTILADRGFGRTELARVCQLLKFNYLVRIQSSAYIEHRGFKGRLREWPIRRGRQVHLHNVSYRKNNPVKQDIAIYWHTKQSEPWYLMTNLQRLPAKQLSKFYSRRMTIEEYFRDIKSPRTGWGLRMTLIKDPDRLSRLLLLLSLAYLLMIAIGRYAQQHYPPRSYCSNNRIGECSYFYIARWLLACTDDPPIDLALNQFRQFLTDKTEEENWG